MTIKFKIDERHMAVSSGFCPRCGARRDEFRPCPACGEERTWAQAHHEAIARGDASGAVNAILAGVAESQGGEAA